MKTIGYARVSKDEQLLDLQLVALRAAQCRHIYRDDGVSAAASRRPGFEAALHSLKPGDTFVIWKVDRAFRSLKQALETMEYFARQGIAFRSLTEHVDTSTPMGEAMYQIVNVFAELERKLIGERTKAGLVEARRRGRRLGRPPLLSSRQIARARELLNSRRSKTADLAHQLGVSPKTLRRALHAS